MTEPSRLFRRSLLRLSWVCSFTLAAVSCKEQLPAYRDPLDVFDGTLTGVYVINHLENALKGYLTVINTFDETLEGRAVMTGELTLMWQSDTTFRKTFTVTDANLLLARQYDPARRHLRLDPSDSLRFGVSWDFFADDGRDLKRLVPFVQDPTCRARYITAAPIPIIIEGHLRVFDRTEVVVFRRVIIQFILTREYVDPRSC